MDLITFPPNLAVLTNFVSSASITWPEYDHVLANGGDLTPGVVSRINRNLQPAYIILDGNHRACLWAKHGKDMPAYVMTSDTTADQILEMEDANQIHRFPHRAFVGGEETYGHLMERAIEAALKLNETIQQVLARV